MKIKVDPSKISKKMYKKSQTSIISKIFILFLIIIILAIIAFVIFKYFFYPLKYFEIVKEEASKNNIDPYLILSVIKTESSFNEMATSNKNAKGLMQIMESTAKDVNLNSKEDTTLYNLYDPKTNISIGSKYLASLITKYDGNYYLAICAYNAGMGNVDKWLTQGIISSNLSNHEEKNIPFNQTKEYLYKVINSYNIYRKIYK